ncbi:MAG: hypothetical protein ABFD29_11765 [Anaerolineaceae bacterium]
MKKSSSMSKRTHSYTNNIQLFVLILTLLLVFIMLARSPLDSDFWWHLQAGKVTYESRSPLTQDVFSLTKFGQNWVNHSWLSELLLYFLFFYGGFPAVTVLVGLVAMGIIFLIYCKIGKLDLVDAFLLIFAAIVIAPLISPRPQIFSLLFFALVNLLFSKKLSFKKQLIIFGVIYLVWSNLHAGFSIGILLMLSIALGKCVDAVLEGNWKENRKNIFEFLFIILMVSFVVMINPNGLNIWKVQFNTVNISVLQSLIPEWASPNFHDLSQIPFLLLVLLLLFLLGVSEKRLTFSEIIPLLLFGGMALLSRRNIAPFTILALPIISKKMTELIDTVKNKNDAFLERVVKPDRQKTQQTMLNKILNLSLVSFLLIAAIVKVYYVSHPVIMDNNIKMMFPKDALKVLEYEPKAAKVFNEYAWGGFLEWSEPNNYYFVDGRTDLFGDEIINEWLEIIESEENSFNLLDKWKIDYVLVQPDRPITSELEKNGWQQIYVDELAVVYKR